MRGGGMQRSWTRVIIAFLAVPVLGAATCNWRVATGPRGLCAAFEIGADRDTITVGDSLALFVRGCDVHLDAFQWASTDTRVATVDGRGVVRALAPGTVTIIATDRQSGSQSNVMLVVRGPSMARVRDKQVECTACRWNQPAPSARSIRRGPTTPRSPTAS